MTTLAEIKAKFIDCNREYATNGLAIMMALSELGLANRDIAYMMAGWIGEIEKKPPEPDLDDIKTAFARLFPDLQWKVEWEGKAKQ